MEHTGTRAWGIYQHEVYVTRQVAEYGRIVIGNHRIGLAPSHEVVYQGGCPCFDEFIGNEQAIRMEVAVQQRALSPGRGAEIQRHQWLLIQPQCPDRSEERRLGNECVSKWSTRWSAFH